MPDVNQNRPGEFAAYLAISGLILTMLATRRAIFVYRPSDFFQPQKVAALAASFPADTEADFIYAAWDYVGSSIEYEQIGSDIRFDGGKVYCEDCYFPRETIMRGIGNCVAKSALLASILANKIPSNRLRIMVGFFGAGPDNGHAWVEIERNGTWYILESTVKPPPEMTWVRADTAYPQYNPGVIMESTGYECDSPAFCVALAKCNCGKIEDKLRFVRHF